MSAAKEPTKALMTRRALIELASKMFAKQGYVDTSMRDIAQRAGLTTGALYGHFRGKADLLAEAISASIADEFGPTSSGPHDEQQMRALLRRNAAHFEGRKRLRALLLQGAAAAQTDMATRARLRNEQRAHLERWNERYEVERENLHIAPGIDLETFALFTWSAEIGLGILEALGISPSPQGWADIHDRLVRGMKPAPE
jgi:AcrR family transcriptional regulator